MDISPETIIRIGLVYPGLLFSLCVHEAAHAAMGNYCGDDTAKLQGRLSLNPLAHVDPVGTVLIPLIMLVMSPFVFGWAKPVPFNPSKLNNIRRDPVLIALAGPAANFLLALLLIFVMRVLILTFGIDAIPPLLFVVLYFTIMLNLVLMIFNLIPVPPLDGHHLLNYFLPPEGQKFMRQLGPVGIIIAMVVAYNFLGPVIDRARYVVDFLIGG